AGGEDGVGARQREGRAGTEGRHPGGARHAQEGAAVDKRASGARGAHQSPSAKEKPAPSPIAPPYSVSRRRMRSRVLTSRKAIFSCSCGVETAFSISGSMVGATRCSDFSTKSILPAMD